MISKFQCCQLLPEVRQKKLFAYISAYAYAYIKETLLLAGKPHLYTLVLQIQTAVLNATSPYSDEERTVSVIWDCPPFVLQHLIMEKYLLLILFSHVGYNNIYK